MLPMTWPLLKMFWSIDRHAMPRLRTLVGQYRDRKRVFRIRTLANLRTLNREVKLVEERT